MKIEDALNKIILGDALEVLKQLPDESVDMIITSPPYYGLRNYGVDGQLGLEKTFDEFLKKILDIAAEIKRVLKPTGSFWLNFGDVYGGIKEGKTDKKVSDYVRESQNGLKKYLPKQEKSLLMMPERIAIKMCDEQGWILRNKIIWAKQILDFKKRKTQGSVMPTSVKDRFNQSYEDLYFFTKSKHYYSDLDAVRLPPTPWNCVKGYSNQMEYQMAIRKGKDYDISGTNQSQKWADKGYKNWNFNENRPYGIDREKEYPNAKRNKFAFNYRVRDAEKKSGQPQFKASEEEINKYGKGSEYEKKYGEPWDRFGKNTKKAQRLSPQELKAKGLPATYIGATGQDHNLLNNPLGKNIPSVWLIGSEPHNFSKELALPDIDHFAIFPQDLVEIPIKFSTKVGDIVCDPFSGSGTTALVARKLSRNFIGIELSEKYVTLSNKRLSQQILI